MKRFRKPWTAGILLLSSVLILTGCKADVRYPLSYVPNDGPIAPHHPHPSDQAANQSVVTTVSWQCNDPDGDPLYYDVYWGDLFPLTLQQSQIENHFDPSTLRANSTYFWQIVAWDDHNHSTEGPVWQFTTEPLEEESPVPGEECVFPLGQSGADIIMVWIPNGHFQMGSPDTEEPVHTVTFAQGFWLGKFEVTQGQWEAVMGNNPSSDRAGGDNYPANNVSWVEIQDFEIVLAREFRLPSESEWEYACRAGTTSRFYWGNDEDYGDIDAYAWYKENSDPAAHPVGGKAENRWNLHDMSGNVFEWCEDWYHEGFDNAPENGSAWTSPPGSRRVCRGGSFCDIARNCRSAYRNSFDPSFRCDYLGFRLAKSSD